MKRKITQAGSAHIIIIIVLVVALLGTLGFVFWQNFINKTDSNKSTDTSTVVKEEETSIDGLKTYVNQKYKLSFEYPSDWSVEVKDDESGGDLNYYRLFINDADGEQVAYLSAASGGVGGTCDPDQAVDISVLKTNKLAIPTDETTHLSYMISPVSVGQTEYIGRLGLTTYYTAIETKQVCPNTIYMMTSIKSLGGITFYDLMFSNGSGFSGKTFTSKQEATDYVNTDEYKKLEAMIKSLDYAE